MGIGLLGQYVVVALAVVLSAGFIVQRQWPDAVRRMRAKAALWLLREGRSPGSRQLGRWIAPAPRVTGAGCSGCNGCGPAERA
jgi:hypothetical protein